MSSSWHEGTAAKSFNLCQSHMLFITNMTRGEVMKSINKYRLIFKFFSIIFIFLLLIFIYNCVKFVFIGYDYTINSDVTVTLTNKYHSSELVEVPSRIWFIDVKKLGKHKTGRDLWGTKTKGIFDCDDTITDLILSEGIEEIEGGAIINCNNLERVIFPSSIKRFSVSSCPQLSEIVFSQENCAIESFQFNDCESLEYINLPNGLKSVSDNAFARCYSLKDIKIPNSICAIEMMAFQDCSSLKTIDLPTELSKIGGNAFQRSGLKSISIPQNVTEIQCWTFESCESLKTVQLSESITNIFDGAFQNCYSLERIDIYEKCSYIAENAFEGCDKLTIYGKKGSYAEKYAKEHSIPFVAL